jgi:hypothetical protein
MSYWSVGSKVMADISQLAFMKCGLFGLESRGMGAFVSG